MRRVAIGLAALLLLTAYPAVTDAAYISEVIVGIGYDNQPTGGRILKPTSTVTNLDWPVYALVRIRDVSQSAAVSADRIGPDGKPIWTTTIRWTGTFSLGWGVFFIPIPGTPNEDKIGQWKIAIRFANETKEVPLTVVPGERTALDTVRAEAEKSANSFEANYRLGVAASMFGENDLAIAQLKKAAQLARTSPYPHIALARHYLKQGMKAEAAESLYFAKGLLMGLREEGFSGWLQQVVEEYLKQTL